ncbi:MAG: GAF domain-containing protein [Desulfuromonadales bacterium]|nr:GAF domain-containing protein [Desulfuromonadales bacterium]
MADQRQKWTQDLPAILLVSAVPQTLQVLKDILATDRYPLLCLDRGAGMAGFLDQHHVGLVFCDLTLPDTGGMDVLRLIRQHSPAIQVVMFSPAQDFQTLRQVLRERALDYLTQPFSPDEVLEIARQGVSSYYHSHHQDDARREAQRRMADLVLLKKVGETASSGGDLQQLFDQILDSIVQSAGVEMASLMLLKEDGMLHIASACGLDAAIANSVRVASGEGISGHVVATGEPVLVTNIDKDRRFTSLDSSHKYKNQSLLSVPIFIRDNLVGVINVNNKVSGEPFDLEDQSLLVTIASQVALAMENFDLVRHLRQQTAILERTNEDLVRLNRARTRLVCNLSHELKTPLTSIMGYIDLSLSFYQKLSDSELQENLKQVREEGERLERLITGMLRLFSIESEREIWRWKAFGVPWSIADAFQYFSKRMTDLGLEIEIDIEEDLPDIYADQEKFGMAFHAMIDNAVKFNRRGGRLRVRARLRQHDGLEYVYVQVYNDGQKIPVEALDSIFGSYTQLGNIDTEKPHGVGIGLALTKVVIDRMLGDVFLEEIAEEGTSFGLLLPTEQTYNILKGDL